MVSSGQRLGNCFHRVSSTAGPLLQCELDACARRTCPWRVQGVHTRQSLGREVSSKLLWCGRAMSYDILRWAIETRHSLTGIYENYVRFFSPHVLGRTATGEPGVIGFQYGGGRPDGRLPPEGDWCFFAVKHLRRLEANGDEWRAGPLESKPLHLIAEIDLQS